MARERAGTKATSARIRELEDLLQREKAKSATAVNTAAYLAARMVETTDIMEARLTSFSEAGKLMLESAEDNGEPLDPNILTDFLKDHVKEQDRAYESAMKDLKARNYKDKVLSDLSTKGAQPLAESCSSVRRNLAHHR